MDVAREECRAIQTTDHRGKPATLLFREFYCADPGCDCRRVVLHVHWAEERRIAASINYAFEPSRRRDEPQIALDPLNPQSEYSDALLALFTEMIGEDREYRERLIRHYTAWRQVVDDPSHPEHAKVRRAAHDDPSFRPAFPRQEPAARRTRAKRGRAAGSQSLQRVAAKAGEADSKLQREFRRRLEKVDRLKQRVRAWKEERPQIDAELSRYAARMDQLHGVERAMVELLDRSYGDAVFGKGDRKKLGALICELAGDLIAEGGHEELKPLYNRYSRSDFDIEAAATDAQGAAALRSMMEMFGMEFGDADVSSLDKLQAFTQDQVRAAADEEAAAEARRATRKKSAKQRAAEARREAEQRSTGKALQDVYRALAKALHPDREQDPAERARKTEVMREVNVAYEAKDLLRLLELQLELEQVAPAQADAIAEERLRHYIRILDEQGRQLAAELEELELPFRLELGREPPAPLAPAEVVARIRADVGAVTQQIAAVKRDLAAFEDVNQLKAWLRTRPAGGRRGRAAGADLFG
ncbi:MAG TPA: J domain-containing protein [Kofleriaceae bacterium]|nr:J domain-containing protein [Kofleriaceae bacterium]